MLGICLHQQVQCLDSRQTEEVVLDALHRIDSLFAGHPLVTKGTGELPTCLEVCDLVHIKLSDPHSQCPQQKLVKGLLGYSRDFCSSVNWAFVHCL